MQFIRTNNGVIIEDWFDNIKLEHCGDAKMGYHKISVGALQQGTYSLEFVSGHEKHYCQVVVHKGAPWKCADGFILKKHCLQENMISASIAKIANVQIHELDDVADERTEAKNNHHEVTVTVDNCTETTHLHAFAHHFIPGNQLQFTQQINMLQ